ncbi:murein hydrolase activator EnvC family protein [Desmospora profundinema]|uniref:Murein DD-endopeptidase MepM/ murein hydrolase activator NlpD n=1 Tax=Desmospora profundinema TaxID=1571184 RepID=A0ABU1ILN5_9BACL|nr:peptidoglycan DD-metalloendopeptidase family protein [Desmospora profundinema]MDR6225606.1 murein DD-endopeptidase MepM/ murein hydrolase activator NlpD [Desmospora profundinema]
MKWRMLVGTMVLCLSMGLFPFGKAQAENDAEKARDELEEIRGEKDDLKGELKEIAEKLDQYEQKMDELANEIDEANQEIEKTEDRLIVIQEKLDEKDASFRDRVRSLYQQGEMGHMTSLFESRSLGEFLARFETLRLLVKQDRHLVDEVANQKKAELKHKRALAQLEREKKKKVEEAEEAFEEMMALRQKNRTQLAQIEEKEQIKESEVRQINLLAAKNGDFKYEGGPLSWPGDNREITSSFGYRTHPVTKVYKLHTGMDIRAKMGDPIYAAADGVVMESKPAAGYGWIILLDHGSGLTTLYAHMYPNQVMVNKGDWVERGETIARVGSYGFSTGPHNHFEVRENGELKNPINYLK